MFANLCVVHACLCMFTCIGEYIAVYISVYGIINICTLTACQIIYVFIIIVMYVNTC